MLGVVKGLLRGRSPSPRRTVYAAHLDTVAREEDPAVITNISLAVIPPPAGAPVPKRLTQRAAVAAWKAEIDKAASTGKFSGVWL
jgi:hypothetical protein